MFYEKLTIITMAHRHQLMISDNALLNFKTRIAAIKLIITFSNYYRLLHNTEWFTKHAHSSPFFF